MYKKNRQNEQAPTSPDRGLLHVWHSAGHSRQLCPDRVLLSRPVLQVSLGEHHGLLLAQGGQVYSFGELLWRDLSVPVSAPVPEVSLLGKTVVRVAAGGFHCGALSEQGSVYMWGENTAGQCGQTEKVPEPCPVIVVDGEVVPPVVVRIVDLACGREHSLALSAQNELWAWGSGCQLGLVTNTFPVGKPQKVEHLAGRHVIQVACGAYHSLALVRRLPPQDYNTQHAPKKKERGQSPHYSVTEREELSAVEDSHYCPLGVELTEVMKGEVNKNTNRNKYTPCQDVCYLQGISSLTFDLLFHSNSGLSGSHSSSPVCLNEVRLCLEKEKPSLQGLKSSSLTNIHQKGKTATSRRSSLPGTPTHGSPRRRHPCACRPSSAGGAPAGAPEEAEDGLPFLETEIWSWGRGSEGQLGHGDQLARLQPLCIKSLTGEEVIKVAAGSHHSLALTAQCQVYSWGSNMCGQLGHVNSPVTVPQQAKLSDGLRVWDLSAGQSHTLLLADGDCVQPVLLYCGQQKEPVQTERLNQSESSSKRSPNRVERYTVMPTLLPFCIEVCRSKMGYVSSVCSGGQSCAVLADHNVMGFISAIHELASRERHLYCWCSSVRKILLTPLRKRESLCPVLGEQCSHLFFSLCESFVQLSTLIGQHATALTYFLHNVQGCDVTTLPLLTHTEYFIDTYKRCLQEHLNCTLLCKAETHHCAVQSVESNGFQSAASSTSCLMSYQSTPGFIKEIYVCDFVLQECLRLPRRRVVCESSNRSLTPQNAGRFSNHWFILFNDALVHTQFSTHHVYPLTCLWVKPVTENGSGLHALKITCPEESFTLVASTPQEKNKWLRSLNQTVDQILGGGGQGSSPAMTRTASYTFTADERFKDAQYTGSWLAGRVHGRGTMKWPDGRLYKGNFKNGLEDGYGDCVIPNKLLNKTDTYQGQWREGKIHGFGKYKYASGEVYEGCFCDGQRHGYGMLSSGKLARNSSSVFIGQWVHDKKTGYGVYDDITRGEKYMGMWLDDQRHGSAVVITQHSVYFEGTFRENKMSGPGLLMSDDDTVFHGEFTDDWTISGKGILTMPNGDSLDGQFSGEWSSGLKVVGTYTKPEHKFIRKVPDLSRSQTKVLECLEFIPQYEEPATAANYDNIRRYLTKACETPHHPLGWLVETLVTAYRMTYVGVGSNRRLLRQAVQEVLAYLTHFYGVIRFLFPGLPDDGSVLPDALTSPSKSRRNSYTTGCVMVVSSSSLLLPLLLPRLYPPLFTLYSLQEEQEETEYWERILRLNKQPDQSLLSFLEVQEKFWPLWMSILGEKKQIVSSSKDACFVSAVETLQQISTRFTPSDKLMVIQKSFEELTLEVKPLLHGDFLWCMDDLFPLFLYVVLRARIRNLGAEISLIEDMMDPNIQHGELGLMFTTLKACYIQIQRETNT
uniref:Alsin Rho guanine nucleotide exchange factor ALS2 a n=1 Tax=Astatotilapia calliptera TaxID=8154 RepID=A0AAX7UVI7_ASTCA